MLARRPHAVLAILVLALSAPAAAQSPGDAKESARHHLRLGVTLFQEQNWLSALAEFEASYRDLHTAAALQNIALCQTRLFRYLEALETLEKLQREFDASLSPEDRDAVRKTMQDLAPLIGTLVIRVDPPDARVTIDGRVIDAARLGQPIRLSSGEYKIAGSAPSRSPTESVVKVAGGEQRLVTLTLVATAGDVSVLASDPGAAIAIDRQAVAYGAWSGSLPPGTHLLQVYKSGFKPFATEITVRAGDRMELRLPLGPADPTASVNDGSASLPYADQDPNRRTDEPPPKGLYGLVSATNTSVLQSPDGFTPDKNGDATGGFFGLRVGYRFNTYFAFEGLFESGGQDVNGTVLGNPDDPASAVAKSYELTTNRYGGNVRLLAGGRSLRFSGTFGVGAVHHTLLLDDVTYKGLNSYFGIELGPQANMGKAILELTLQTTFEGTTSVRGNGVRAYSEHTIIPQAGIGLRVGYGEWGRW